MHKMYIFLQEHSVLQLAQKEGDRVDLPARITFLRKSLKLTQTQFGDLVNVSQRSVASWEAGDRSPSLATLCELADKLNVSVDYLVGRSDDMRVNDKELAVLNGESPRGDIINLILSLPDPEFELLSVFLQGMSAGKGIASRSQAVPHSEDKQSE